ncbi:HAD family hydrolase [Methylomonas methanica]|uniref:Uncharacterized protein n=1 Tax=Methylomonas methanica TaxID=421 RepID=A0A177MRN8_METMH|nr:hypothetical protein [Methylomonas methanica]OAI07550.1 hypothetical protein A1332_08685 [Methylomonas methanica]
MIKAYSFDIFDTCITRVYTYPTDLFFDLSCILLTEYSPIKFNTDTIKKVASLRQRAEHAARRQFRHLHEDIQLLDIYRQFQYLLPWSIDIERAMHMEMQLEKESLRPVFPIKHKIHKLREQGYRIIFISDMYLPSIFIKQCLIDFEIANDEDSIYVSGELGITKYHGTLFTHVLTTESLNKTELVHCGDNPHSDVNVPRKIGIATQPFQEIQLSHHEQRLLSKTKKLLDISKLVAHTRLTRLSDIENSQLEHNRLPLISGVISPLLTSFTAWVLRTAEAEGIQRLYFVSRDGQILYNIAQQLKFAIPAPECRYLHGSRQAWFLPSVIKCTRNNLHWLTIPGSSTAIRDILSRLNLTPTDLKEPLTEAGFSEFNYDKQLIGGELEKFKQFLFRTPCVTQIIEQKASAARAILASYFEQEKLNDGTSWAIVDMGWRLNCQQALKTILNSLEWSCQPKGFYFELASDHLSESEAGWHKSYLSHKYPLFSRRRLLIEHVFTPANHATVVGYRRTGKGIEPIFKATPSDDKLTAYTEQLHRLCIEFSKNTIRAGLWTNYNPVLDSAILRNAVNFLDRPSKEDAETIKWIPIMLDQLHNHQYNSALANPVTIQNLLKLIGYELGLSISPPSGCYWLEGSAALSSPGVKVIIFSLLFTKRRLQRFLP